MSNPTDEEIARAICEAKHQNPDDVYNPGDCHVGPWPTHTCWEQEIRWGHVRMMRKLFETAPGLVAEVAAVTKSLEIAAKWHDEHAIYCESRRDAWKNISPDAQKRHGTPAQEEQILKFDLAASVHRASATAFRAMGSNPKEVVWCSACNKQIDFRVLADCHPYGREGCAFEARGGNGQINMPKRQVYSVPT